MPQIKVTAKVITAQIMMVDVGKRLFKEWVERLGLTDWHFTFKTNVRPENMGVPDSEGCTTWTESTKSAWIDIMDEQFRSEYATARPFDFERTLVHELLHCKLSLLCDEKDSLKDRICHQVIDDLARAFVDAKRSGNK